MLTALLKYREAIDEVRDGGATKGTVEFLLRRMQHKSDFPALSESILTLNRLSSSDDENIDRLAGIIVRDFALTSKILRVVNSALCRKNRHYHPGHCGAWCQDGPFCCCFVDLV